MRPTLIAPVGKFANCLKGERLEKVRFRQFYHRRRMGVNRNPGEWNFVVGGSRID